MKRSIVQHGSSSLTITLPVKWVSKHHLQKGHQLDVIENGTSLIITTNSVAVEKKIVIDVSTQGIVTQNDLSHVYQLGYDEIEIVSMNAKTLEEVQKRIPECIGFVIIEQSPTRILIKSVAVTLEKEFDVLLKKSFQIVNDMAKDLGTAMSKQDISLVSAVRSMEALNNRFTDVCIRILHKQGYEEHQKTMQIYELVKKTERLADEFKYIADHYLTNPIKLSAKFLSLYDKVVEYYLLMYTIYYAYKPALKEKAFLNRKSLQKDLESALMSSKGVESLLLHHLLALLRKSYECVGTCLSLKI